jgi:hypothetical protein
VRQQAHELGAVLGLAIVTSLANSRAAEVLAAGGSTADALTAGFQRGLLVACLLAVANLVLALVAAPRVRPDAELLAEASAAG